MDTEASGFNTNETVAIIGLGLMGGSFARACGASERSISSLSIPMKRPFKKPSRKGWSTRCIRRGVQLCGGPG